MKEIGIDDIPGFKIGNAQDMQAGTGVTVVVCPEGAACGVDISGGGPASRETTLCSTLSAENPLHAAVLSGGSAFGLAASDGVMSFLEEHDIGFKALGFTVPLVVQSCLFDISYKQDVRPDAAMGRAACEDAWANTPCKSGPDVGAGCGATVGKFAGMECCSKSGLGVAALQIEDLQVGAIVAVNAVGDVFDFETNEQLAGMHASDGGFASSTQALLNMQAQMKNRTADSGTSSDDSGAYPSDHTNTTLGIIITNAGLDRAQMNKVAALATNAYARCIHPVGTTNDGDSIYAMAHGTVKSDVNIVGVLAEQALCRAIRNAVTQ